MKYKEPLLNQTICYCDKIEKLFDEKTASLCFELEKTIQDFWNIDRQTANLLNMLIKIHNSKNVLEVGTSNGYSSIWIAHALLKTKGKLTTIEFWQKRVDMAKENFQKAGVLDIITALTGDAVEILKQMANSSTHPSFDFVFLDANKAQYIEYFNSIDKMLSKGGIIVADNIISHYHKTKNYVDNLMANENYQNLLLNFDAGLLVSLKC